LAGEIDVSDTNFQKKIDDNLIDKSKICVARSLVDAVCVWEGKLYLPDSFLTYLRFMK